MQTPMRHREREVLRPLADDLFTLVANSASKKQWADWLRVALEHASASGDLGLVTKLLQAGANVKSRAATTGCRSRTVLDAAAEGGNDGVVSALLGAGADADLNVRSGSKRRSALHRAAFLGHDSISRTLILAGADLGVLDSEKRTPLLLAVREGHVQVAYSLLLAGACPNAKDRWQDTALHVAAGLGHGQIVGALLLTGADPNATDDCGRSALHLAAENGHLAAAEFLLAAGADIDHRYGDSEISVLDSAAAHGNVDILRALLRSHSDSSGGDGAFGRATHVVDVNTPDSSGYTALHMAADNNQVGAIDVLVEAGADIQAQDQHDWTPLHSAARYDGCSEAVQVLLQTHGANVGASDTAGETPLHVACSYLAAGPAELLLRFGADETAVNSEGHTPLDVVGIYADDDASTIEDLYHATARDENIRRLLGHAPQDRAWRRRGPLVLCRHYRISHQIGFVNSSCSGRGHHHKLSRSDERWQVFGNVVGGGGEGSGWRDAMERGGTSTARAVGGSGEAVWRVVLLAEEGIFRAIVGFL